MWDDGVYLPGELAGSSSFTPEVASPGAGMDWSNVLIQGLSTWGNVKVAETRAAAQAPLGVRTVNGVQQIPGQGVAVGNQTIMMIGLLAVVAVVLMRRS
jgi:hypothetical protein